MHLNAVLEKLAFFGRGLVCANLAQWMQFSAQKACENALFVVQKGGVRLGGGNAWLWGVSFSVLLVHKSTKAYTAKGNVQQNGRFGGVFKVNGP